MTSSGWIILALSVGSVSLLFIWCIYKVLSTPHETEHIHGFEQATPDEETDAWLKPRIGSGWAGALTL
jgi:hypothetical protein